MLKLDGVAIVTGGGRGIGRAISEELHRSGMTVVVAENATAVDGGGSGAGDPDLLPAQSDKGLFVENCDVKDHGALAALVGRTVARHGRVDALVNVAGISRPGRLAAATTADMRAVFDVNVAGSCNAIAAVLPVMTKQGGGCIINTASTAGFLGSRRQPAYSAAKESLIGLTRVLAARLQGHGISVNALAPTGNSRMSKGLIQPSPPGIADTLDPSFFDHDPRHVAEFNAFLCDPRHRHVTGRLFLVASGYVGEYEHVRPLKSLGAVRSLIDSGRFEGAVSWVLGMPNFDDISPMPSREFQRLAPVKYWESASDLKTPRT